MSELQQPEFHPPGVSNLDGADGPKDVVSEHAENREDDNISTFSSDLSDTDTLDLLSLSSTPDTELRKTPRELGLSTLGWFSDFADFEYVPVKKTKNKEQPQ